MSVEVAVPDGCCPGDEFAVDISGYDEPFSVVVPDDGYPGMLLVVDIPPREVSVTIPDGISAGGQLLVEWEGEQFSVQVPEGCFPGDSILVSPPVRSEGDSQQPQEEEEEPDHVPSALSACTTGCSSSTKPTFTPGAGGKGLNLNLALGNGLTLTLGLQTAPKYPLGSRMEVLRSDGYWSPCTIRDYEWRGVTYTVELDDTRLKYFVEEEDLRFPE